MSEKSNRTRRSQRYAQTPERVSAAAQNGSGALQPADAVRDAISYEQQMAAQQRMLYEQEMARRQYEAQQEYARQQYAAQQEYARQQYAQEQARRQREAEAAQNPRPDNVPSDYTMSQPQQEEPVYQLPNETLLLIWSIVLTAMFSLAGLIGLIKVVKARKEPSTARRSKLLSSAKIWLIVGTVLHVLPFLAELF